MSRPKKSTVDYFPHYVHHGRVLAILESRHGNDGYSVFYKLLELLGCTEGHCYDCQPEENWEYLISKMLIDEPDVVSILNKLAAMNIIDQELWQEKRIWMQSFVDSLSFVYERRKVGLPQRPGLMYTETPLSGNKSHINPQSKVKEVKESKDSLIPHSEIVELYHRELSTLPHVKKWTPARQSLLRSTWKDNPEYQTPEAWKNLFIDIREHMPFLMGSSNNGARPFTADLEWIVKPANFVKIIEGKYKEKKAKGYWDDRTIE